MEFKPYEKLSVICHTTGLVKGVGHELFCVLVYKDLPRFKSICDVTSGIECTPLAWSLPGDG